MRNEFPNSQQFDMIQTMKERFEIIEVSGQFYAVLFDESGNRVSTDGPYQERYQAESMSRIREI